MRAIVILLALLSACAGHPDKDYPCRMDCAPKPKQQDHRGMVKVCEIRGSMRRCTYVTREELQRVLREAGLTR